MASCVDHDLATRLELAEADANASFVESRHALQPDIGACWLEVAGAKAMFDGPGSMISQTFGFGMKSCPTAAEFAEVEDFFFSRHTDVNHEICPLGSPELLSLFRQHGYFPVERSTVLFRELDQLDQVRVPDGMTVRLCDPSEQEKWVETSVAGWDQFADYADVMRDFGNIGFRRGESSCWLAEKDDQPIATGSTIACNGVALLAGASTVPSARRQGAQLALLHTRLADARDRGCDLAMMAAEPGSASQRNAERNGFRIAYTRTKWAKPFQA